MGWATQRGQRPRGLSQAPHHAKGTCTHSTPRGALRMSLGSAGLAFQQHHDEVGTKSRWVSPSCAMSLGFVSWLEMHLEHLVTSAQGLVVKTLVVGEEGR